MIVGLDDGFAVTRPGGIRRYTLALQEALESAGSPWTPVRVSPPRWLAALPPPPRRLCYLCWAPMHIRHAGLDLIHFTNHVVPLGLTIPAVATIHDLGVFCVPSTYPPPYRVFQRVMLRATARRASLLLTPSETVRQEVLRTLRVSPDRVLVGGDGSTLASQAVPVSRPAPAPPFRLLGVGRLERRKAWGTLLDAVAVLQGRGVSCEVTLFGQLGFGSEELRAHAAALGTRAPVRLIHDGEDTALIRAYQTADLLVAPSSYEGFDLPVLEAMAFGVPVVASDIAVHHELLEDEGLFFRPRDATDLAAVVEAILGSPGRYEALTRRLPVRARRFGPEAFARSHASAYDLALSTHSARRG